jgi:hypothetical protein
VRRLCAQALAKQAQKEVWRRTQAIESARADPGEITDGYRKLLPQGISTSIAIHFNLAPGIAVADIQRGLARRLLARERESDASIEELLAFASEVGVDRLMAEGQRVFRTSTRKRQLSGVRQRNPRGPDTEEENQR